MGIRALCAAAAVVVGAGSAADAATVDRVSLTLDAEYICEMDICEDPEPAVDFYGLPTDGPVTGWLSIGDENSEWLRSITFTLGNSIIDFGRFQGTSGEYQNADLLGFFTDFFIRWNGTAGSLSYRDDGAPWSLDVQGTIELAPVPLPATAALLPMGLGALAMMRRRRRS